MIICGARGCHRTDAEPPHCSLPAWRASSQCQAVRGGRKTHPTSLRRLRHPRQNGTSTRNLNLQLLVSGENGKDALRAAPSQKIVVRWKLLRGTSSAASRQRGAGESADAHTVSVRYSVYQPFLALEWQTHALQCLHPRSNKRTTQPLQGRNEACLSLALASDLEPHKS